jgi:hypothetical protein
MNHQSKINEFIGVEIKVIVWMGIMVVWAAYL